MLTVIYDINSNKIIMSANRDMLGSDKYNSIISSALSQSSSYRVAFTKPDGIFKLGNGHKLYPNMERKFAKIKSDVLSLERKNASYSSLSPKSAYFSVLRGRDNVVRMFYRDNGPFSGNNGYASHIESSDGIKFINPKTILQNELMCHNFFPFLDTNPNANPEHIYKAVARNINSVATFVSQDCKKWDPLNMHSISPSHPGMLTKRTQGGEFDGHMCCFYDKYSEKYIIYTRCNYDVGIRHIQYATSCDFENWSPFKIINVHPNFDLSRDNYYFPGFYPINIPEYDNPLYFGIIPYSIRKYACFNWMVSNNLHDWHIIHSDMYDDGWKYRGSWRNRNHPVIGYILSNDKSNIYFYVHENYAKNSSGKNIKISRYEIPTYKFYNIILANLGLN